MSRPSYDTLLNENTQLRRNNRILSVDDDWTGQEAVFTPKAAMSLEIPRIAESARYVVVISFDLRSLRDPGGIRRVLGTRAPDVLLRVRWNHAEALLILAAHPEEYCQKVVPIIRNEGLHAALYYTPFSGSVSHDYERAVHSRPAHQIGEGGQNG